MKAEITDIKRFAVHDGDGIRTTVFFKGCSLRCLWCHNPENICAQKQLGFFEHKCILCGKCAEVCANHTVGNGGHIIDRKSCTACGKCAEVCPADALTVYGKTVDTGEISRVLLQDKNFYAESGGGITLSGGECLLQSKACREILMNMKDNGINTAVDTAGYVAKSAIDDVLPYTDVFLYDIKALDDGVHKKCTGRSNRLIIDNLKYLENCGKRVEIRIPSIPHCNDDQVDKIREYLSGFHCIERVRVLPYNSLARAKYPPLGMSYPLGALNG